MSPQEMLIWLGLWKFGLVNVDITINTTNIHSTSE